MAKLWAGRTAGDTSKLADDFNSSISFDSRMYRQDITGSMAHAAMLGAQGIIPQEEARRIIDGLQGILDDLESGALAIDPACEDIHMFVEQVLTERIGDAGKRLHTARSRNDQVALDLRLYLRDEIDAITGKIRGLIGAVAAQAETYKAAILPGYTHLQRAQPVTFGHHLMVYAMMLLRDIDRLGDCRRRVNVSPIGCCALAGTTYATDRAFEAARLGLDGVCLNSMDGVSDRDFCLETLGCLSILMMHLSRFAEEVILWSSWEFKFIELSDAFTTGSSIMPQKKNPDMAELVRGKTGRVYGDLMGLLATMKSLPLAYNKDMQEDKEPVFDAIDTVELCIPVFAAMIKTMTVLPKNMAKAASGGFINATDCADYLTRKGMPFREAYMIVGRLVNNCIKSGDTLDTLTLRDFQAVSSLFQNDIYDALALQTCVNGRKVYGGPAEEEVLRQIGYIENFVQEHDAMLQEG